MIPPRKQSGPPPRKPKSQLAQVEAIVAEAKKAADDGQGLLLDVDEDWRKEWQGMPEFSKTEQKPYRTLLVHFKNSEDVVKFALLVGCKVTSETRYIWWPKIELKRVSKLRVEG